MKKIILIITVILSAVVFSSCSDSDKLIGSWRLEDNSLEGNKRNSFISSLTFEKDNYYTAVIAGENFHAKWRFTNNNQLELYSPDDDDSIIYDYSFETKNLKANKLILKGFVNRTYFSYTFKKIN